MFRNTVPGSADVFDTAFADGYAPPGGLQGGEFVNNWQELRHAWLDGGAVAVPGTDPTQIARYVDVASEYLALTEGSALIDRADRGLIEITGSDRTSWLHNLTTNQVSMLSVGDGNYAFSLNQQGRILFDLNILVRDGAIWIDLHRCFLDAAQTHFGKYKVMEHVTLRDLSAESVRLGVAGRKAFEAAARLGAPQAERMAQLNHTTLNWEGATLILVRHDFCGAPAVELIVPADVASACWQWLVDSAGAVPVGDDAVQIKRIEAGIPWPGCEIRDEYLPAETGQFERAVNFRKGCYLGQEIVERMRSRNVVARRLVGLRFEGHVLPAAGAALSAEDGSAVGSVTSVCHSLADRGGIGLGYARTASAEPGTRLFTAVGANGTGAVVVSLPFAAPSA
jgi:folate-binding protein YgfZ